MEPLTGEISLFNLTVDEKSTSTLKTAGMWAKILAILGFVFGTLFILGGIYVFNNLVSRPPVSFLDGANEEYRARISTTAYVVLAIFLIMGSITIIGSLFALMFGSKLNSAIDTNDSETFRNSFVSLRNFFAFWAVLMAIYLVLILVNVFRGSYF